MEGHWDKFLIDLYKFLSSYDIQSEREIYNVKNISDWGSRDKPQGLYINNNFQEFLRILEMNDIDTKDVKNENYQPYLQKINEIVTSTLKQKPYVHCQNKIPVIDGGLVTTSQTSFGNVCPIENNTGINQFKIFASDTIYLDADWYFFSPNFTLTIMAPKIVVKSWRHVGFEDDTSRFFIVGKLVSSDHLTIHNGQTKIISFTGQPSNITLEKEETDQLSEFKISLRSRLPHVTWISKTEIKKFLKKFHGHPDIIRNFKFDTLVDEFVALEEQFKSYREQHVELFSSYSDLLGVISKKLETERYTSDEKIVLYHVYTSLLTKLNILEKNIVETNIVIKVEDYLKVMSDQFEGYKKYGVEEIILDGMRINIEGLNSMIKDGKNFIKNYILSDNIQHENVFNTNINALAKLLDQLGDLGLLVNQVLTKTNQVLENLSIKDIEKIGKLEEIQLMKDLIGKIKFEEMASMDMKKFNDVEGAKIQKIKFFSKSIHDDVVVLLAQVTDDIDVLGRKLSTTSFASLDITKWQVPKLLKRAKYQAKQFPENTTSNILESLNTFINIYQRIESFYWQKKIKDFIAPLYLTNWDTRVNNTNSSVTVKNLKETIVSNLLLAKYENDVDVVKQYTFPYFNDIANKYKLVPLMLLQRNATELADVCKDKVNLMAAYVFRSFEPINQYRMTSLTYDYPRPLAVWNHTEHQEDFAKFFSGEEILLKADIRNSSSRKNGVRFRDIEIHFNAVDKTNQKMIDNLLVYFKVKLTHSGNSYYRCGNKTYLITTAEVPLVYSCVLRNGRRMLMNQVYDKIISSDGILSPYTTWRLQISIANRNSYESIDSLRGLGSLVDLHLVAQQNYLTDNQYVCNRDIDSYYDFDGLIKESPNTRAKRFAGPTSAASTIYSPINDAFGFMAGAITRINYLGGFAVKSIGVIQESYLPPTIFYDQVNSALILAPILLFLGKNYFNKTPAIYKQKIQTSRKKIWIAIIENLKKIVSKYKIAVTWLKMALEDKIEEVALVRNANEAEELENDLVAILVDFLDDIRYDPAFERVKFDRNFVFDVDELIKLGTQVPDFANKLNFL